MSVFIDSNIPMYVAGGPHPNKAPSRHFLDQVRSGRLEACASTEVLQEILCRYSSIRRLDMARQVYELFVEICPVILPVTLADTDRALEILSQAPGVSARDAIHAAVMINNGVEQIATFDRGFDVVDGIGRIELRSTGRRDG